MKPLGVTLVTGAAMVAAIVAWNPIVLAAALLAGAALLAVAEGPKRAYVSFALVAAVTVLVINPFVSVQGLTVLWQGPSVPSFRHPDHLGGAHLRRGCRDPAGSGSTGRSGVCEIGRP